MTNDTTIKTSSISSIANYYYKLRQSKFFDQRFALLTRDYVCKDTPIILVPKSYGCRSTVAMIKRMYFTHELDLSDIYNTNHTNGHKDKIYCQVLVVTNKSKMNVGYVDVLSQLSHRIKFKHCILLDVKK